MELNNTENTTENSLETKSESAIESTVTTASETVKDIELSKSSEPVTETPKEIIEEAETDKAEKENIEAGTEKDEALRSAYEQAYEDIYAEILEHFRTFSPSDEIACKITEDHITEYLEGNRAERRQEFLERREKRILSALQLIAVLVAIIFVVKFLGNNPAILVNILYIIAGLGAFYIWKNPHKKDKEDE